MSFSPRTLSRRSRAHASVAAVAAMLLMGGAIPAQAEEPAPGVAYDPKEECSAKNWGNFGVNCDGWHVKIINDTDYEFAPTEEKVAVHTSTGSIAPHSTNENGRGKQSWVGGPADMKMVFRAVGEEAIRVIGEGDLFGFGVVSDFSGDAGYRNTMHRMSLVVDFEEPVSDEPITIHITKR